MTAAGVFRRLVHQADSDAWAVEVHGITYTFTRCGAAAIPTEKPQPDWPWCVPCWASGVLGVQLHPDC